MKIRRNKSRCSLMLVLVIAFLCLLAGCSGTQEGAAAISESPEPATLIFFNDIGLPPSDVESLIVQPAKKKFPHITLQVIHPGKGNTMDDLIVSGQLPDIILGGFYNQAKNDSLGVIANLNDLIKEGNVDMSKFPSALTDTFKLYSPHWYALPLYLNIPALWYNKDIFDRFGVPYPSDNFTWTEAIDLGRKLTRSEGGVNYIGFYPGNWSFLAGQLAVPRIDPGTNSAVFETPEMKMVFQTL